MGMVRKRDLNAVRHRVRELLLAADNGTSVPTPVSVAPSAPQTAPKNVSPDNCHPQGAPTSYALLTCAFHAIDRGTVQQCRAVLLLSQELQKKLREWIAKREEMYARQLSEHLAHFRLTELAAAEQRLSLAMQQSVLQERAQLLEDHQAKLKQVAAEREEIAEHRLKVAKHLERLEGDADARRVSLSLAQQAQQVTSTREVALQELHSELAQAKAQAEGGLQAVQALQSEVEAGWTALQQERAAWEAQCSEASAALERREVAVKEVHQKVQTLTAEVEEWKNEAFKARTAHEALEAQLHSQQQQHALELSSALEMKELLAKERAALRSQLATTAAQGSVTRSAADEAEAWGERVLCHAEDLRLQLAEVVREVGVVCSLARTLASGASEGTTAATVSVPLLKAVAEAEEGLAKSEVWVGEAVKVQRRLQRDASARRRRTSMHLGANAQGGPPPLMPDSAAHVDT